ncbi:cupin domain-containing protein [Streptomyces sclerotialus]|uniref:cupin domain-containing protein n=1 Tax=Streptomyces sclerotialus TaxID=1957 RepID=UPI0004CC132D
MSGIQIQRQAEAVVHEEYGCAFRRILPWQHTGPSDTGMGVCTVAPGGVTTPHSHEDHEHFYVVRGHGLVEVDGVRTEIGPGDALVVASQQTHHFTNLSATDELEMVSVWSLGPFGANR